MFYNITNINQPNREVSIHTVYDRTSFFQNGTKVQIQSSTSNDGIYTVDSSIYDGAETTIVTIVESIPSGSISGTMNIGVALLDIYNDTIVLPPMTVNDVDTSISLIGYGYIGDNYNQYTLYHTNSLRILESFSNVTPPTNAIIGQQWYDVNVQALKTFNGSTWTTGFSLGGDDLLLTDNENGSSTIVMSASDGDYGISIRSSASQPNNTNIVRILDATGNSELSITNNKIICDQIRVSSVDDSFIQYNTTVGSSANGLYTLDVVGNSTLNHTTLASQSIIRTVDLGGINKVVTLGDPINPSELSTKAYFDSVFSQPQNLRMPTDVALPISRNISLIDSDTVLSTSGFEITFKTLDVFLNGTQHYVSSFNYNLTTIQADPSNSTFYVYANDDGSNSVTIMGYTTIQSPSNEHILLARVVTDSTEIVNVISNDITEIDSNIVTHEFVPSASVLCSDEFGYIKSLKHTKPVSFLTDNVYVISTVDESAHLVFTSSTNVNIIINTNDGLPIGTQISIRRRGTGRVGFSAGTGITLVSPGFEREIQDRFGTCYLLKESSTLWSLSGELKVVETLVGATTPTSDDGTDGDIYFKP